MRVPLLCGVCFLLGCRGMRVFARAVSLVAWLCCLCSSVVCEIVSIVEEAKKKVKKGNVIIYSLILTAWMLPGFMYSKAFGFSWISV